MSICICISILTKAFRTRRFFGGKQNVSGDFWILRKNVIPIKYVILRKYEICYTKIWSCLYYTQEICYTAGRVDWICVRLPLARGKT